MRHVRLPGKLYDKRLSNALELLKNAKPHKRILPDGGLVSFSYVSILEHKEFINPLKELALKYKLTLAHPRLSRYEKGDLIDLHVDTIPNAVWAGVWLLQSRDPRLVIEYEQDLVLLPDLVDQILLFDPKLKHAVLPIRGNVPRIVVNFWLCDNTLILE